MILLILKLRVYRCGWDLGFIVPRTDDPHWIPMGAP
jgi:hypothetical protein